MSDNTLSIIAELKAKEGKRDDLKSALQALISPTRQEAGCLDYALFQLQDSPDVFYMRESWKGQEALDSHIALPHFQAFVQQMESLLAEPLKLIRLNAVEP